MIWRAIRYGLIAASIAGLVWFLYDLRTIGPPPPPERWIYMFLTFFLVNLVYLLFAGDREPSRLLRMIRLWLDAKEAELRKHARENSN